MAGTWICMYGHITDLDETNGTIIYFDNFLHYDPNLILMALKNIPVLGQKAKFYMMTVAHIYK